MKKKLNRALAAFAVIGLVAFAAPSASADTGDRTSWSNWTVLPSKSAGITVINGPAGSWTICGDVDAYAKLTYASNPEATLNVSNTNSTGGCTSGTLNSKFSTGKLCFDIAFSRDPCAERDL